MKKLIFICLILSIFVLGGCNKILPQGCTEEAKICPDGSGVGRNPELGCEFDPCPYSESSFEIHYSFGVQEKSSLDTNNNVYIKDMCTSSKAYDFKLTEPEKKLIYDSIIENDLLNIKNDFTGNCDSEGICQEISPESGATLKIMIGDETKVIAWKNNYIKFDDPDLRKFNNVRNVIENIIIQKENELDVEPANCGYD